jgi:hypothetical protein
MDRVLRARFGRKQCQRFRRFAVATQDACTQNTRGTWRNLCSLIQRLKRTCVFTAARRRFRCSK